MLMFFYANVVCFVCVRMEMRQDAFDVYFFLIFCMIFYIKSVEGFVEVFRVLFYEVRVLL